MRSKKGIVIAILFLVIGFATVTTTLILNGTVGIGENSTDYNVIFTNAKVGNVAQAITTTTKTSDTLEVNVLLNKVGEDKVLTYTIKNNSTQYGAKAKMKCYAVNDTAENMGKYINISGEIDSKTITFAAVEANATLSEEITLNAQQKKNGTITMSLKKSYAGENELSVSFKCEIITNATESDELKQPVTAAGLYDEDDNLLCAWDTCGIDVSKDYNDMSYTNDTSHITYITNNLYQTATKLIVPNSVTNIGENAFYGCIKLTNVILPEGLISISNNAFVNCENLTNLIIPEGVVSIGNFAFYNCSAFTNIIIPNSVNSIGNYAFNNCRNLRNVSISNNVTNIGVSTFTGCQNLRSVTIPNSVTTIENNAFSNCTSLTDLMVPSSVTNIGENAFGNVPHVTYGGSATGSPWGAKAIN